MTHVVVGSHDEAGVHERHDHVEIPPRMLTETVNELNNALGLAGGNVYPTHYLVTTV